MRCPQCNNIVNVVMCDDEKCKCHKNAPVGTRMRTNVGAGTDTCPHCGYTETADAWFMIDMEQNFPDDGRVVVNE